MKLANRSHYAARHRTRALQLCLAVFALAAIALVPTRVFADDNLIAHWAFDETSGTTATDTSGNGHDGANTNATISTDTPPTAFSNARSLSFNGSDSSVEAAPQAALTGNHSRTISLWFKTTVADTTQGIFDSGGIGHDTAMEIYTVADGGAGVNPPTNPGGIAIVMWDNDIYVPIGISAVANGQWHLLTFTYDEATQQSTLYFDGAAPQAYLWDGGEWSPALQTQPFTTVDPLNTIANDVLIGQARTGYFGMGNNFFNGTIDDVRIYDTALTATQVNNLAGGSDNPSVPVSTNDSTVTNDSPTNQPTSTPTATNTSSSPTPTQPTSATLPSAPNTGLPHDSSLSFTIALVTGGILVIGTSALLRRTLHGSIIRS